MAISNGYVCLFESKPLSVYNPSLRYVFMVDVVFNEKNIFVMTEVSNNSFTAIKIDCVLFDLF